MSKTLRLSNLPVLIFIFSSLAVVFTYYTGLFPTLRTTITAWPSILANFAIILGAANIVRYHGAKLVKMEKDWDSSALSLIFFFATILSAYFYEFLYDWIISNIVMVYQVAITSYVGFYNLTLLYRAARVRNYEVGVLLGSTILVMLWNGPFQAIIPDFIYNIGEWINKVPNSGAMRGMNILFVAGMIALLIRSILGYERSFLGGE